ncbi:MAG: 50S ribosomal protein L24e [Candidatus Micrarchaeia archaeon]
MKCSYCSKDIEPGTGIMFVRKSGAIRYYCSNRCYKLDVLHRKKRSGEIARTKAKNASAAEESSKKQ